MRDPARIPRILEALRVEWEKQPDLRLGQLLINAVTPRAPLNPGGMLFYLEDAALVEAVKDPMAPRGPKEKQ